MTSRRPEGGGYCQWIARVEPGLLAQYAQEAVDLRTASLSGASILPGFAISKYVYLDFFRSAALQRKLRQAAEGCSPSQPQYLAGAALQMRRATVSTPLPREARQHLQLFWREFRVRLIHGDERGLRLTLASAGPAQESFSLSQVVRGPEELEKMLKQLYSLQFTDRSLLERLKAGRAVVLPAFAVLVQHAEPPTFSGEAFCHDPAAHDDTTIQIEAYHCQKPNYRTTVQLQDLYRLDRKSLALLSKQSDAQWWADDGQGSFVSPLHAGKSRQTLSDEQIVQLARQVRLAQSQFSETRRFSWLFAHGQFWLARVVPYEESKATAAERHPSLPLLQGISGSLGVATGAVRLIRTTKDRQELRDGEIAVLRQMVDQDYRWLAGAAGIISEHGSQTGPEASLARQMGIPAVVGTGSALAHLRQGQLVTLDGTHGAVYAGRLQPSLPPAEPELPPTGTKICVTITDPYLVSREALHQADGVGLLRSEFILRLLGLHPEEVLQRRAAAEYGEILAEGITRVAKAVYPRPVIYQLHDLGSMELIGLHPRQRERREPNPVLGYRGSHRLLAEPELLELELRALEEQAKAGLHNLSVMMPMARSLDEVRRMLAILEKSALPGEPPLELWVKCETPAMLILMEELCQLEIGGVCFDVPALSQLILGIDRENRQVAHHLDPTDQSIRQALAYAIATCRAHGVSTMLSAEGEQLRPEVVQAAVQAGVTALSVPTGEIEPLHHLVAAVERQMALQGLLEEPLPIHR